MIDDTPTQPAGAPLWSVIAAAGIGARMQHSMPKQYMPVAGIPMLQRSIDAMLAVPGLDGVVVVLAEHDPHWTRLAASHDARVHCTTGGALRAESVAAGVDWVRRHHGGDVWVLVHDAARPLVSGRDVARLLTAVFAETTGAGASAEAGAGALSTDPPCVGGLLATPVQDTLKRGDAVQSGPAGSVSHSLATVSRDRLWQAQTPQLFRAAALADALAGALAGAPAGSTAVLTDEASAFEQLGHAPLLVEAEAPNLKITWPRDLVVAEALLTQAGDTGASACE